MLNNELAAISNFLQESFIFITVTFQCMLSCFNEVVICDCFKIEYVYLKLKRISSRNRLLFDILMCLLCDSTRFLALNSKRENCIKHWFMPLIFFLNFFEFKAKLNYFFLIYSISPTFWMKLKKFHFLIVHWIFYHFLNVNYFLILWEYLFLNGR